MIWFFESFEAIPLSSNQNELFPVLETGVIAIIAVALLIVTALVVFAIWHRLTSAKRLKKER